MIHGILNVRKEKGYTSHDVVAKLRGITRQKKIGHTGTLDPDAVGVLPVCLGRATRLCDMITDRDKTYETVLLLGRTTDTQDIGGQTIRTGRTEGLKEDEVRRVIWEFVGEYAQIPPMYSALKVNGRKLYELAREGKEVERKARNVQIFGIEILKAELPRVWMRVKCSKGTYIRTLCHDIGERLSCGGCMEELTRTCVGRFSLKDSLSLDEIAERSKSERLSDVLVPMDAMFDEYPGMTVQGTWESLAKNGNPLPLEAFREGEDPRGWLWAPSGENPEYVRIYDEKGRFIAVYRWQKEKEEYRIVKMFYVE